MSQPVATAGWGDLVGIIIFLIVSGWINYSRRKKAEEEAQGADVQDAPGSRTVRSSPQGGAAAPGRRPAPAGYGDDGADGEDGEEWGGDGSDGERSGRWNDHGVRETRAEEARDPEARSGEVRSVEQRYEKLTGGRGRPGIPGKSPAPARPPEIQRSTPGDRDRAIRPKDPVISDKAKEKAAEMGKDLLTKLARELGIELPKPEPKPAPRPATTAPPPAYAGRAATRLPGTGTSPRGSAGPDEIRARAAEEARSRSHQVTHRAPGPGPSPWSGTPAGMPPASVTAAELAHPEALRKAFILKTILDRPLSMRPPSGPGPSIP